MTVRDRRAKKKPRGRGRTTPEISDSRAPPPPSAGATAGSSAGATAGSSAGIPPTDSGWRALWREHRRNIVAFFGLAAVLRLVVLLDLSTTPYFELTNIDTKSYQRMAVAILRDGWLPRDVFYQSGLYAYFLAVLYEIFGTGAWIPRIAQSILGSLSVVCVYLIGARLLSVRAGALAAAMLAVYGPLILEEVVLLKTALVVFSALAALALFVYAAPARHRVGLFASGFAFGIATVGSGQWIVAIPALAVSAGLLAASISRKERAILSAIFFVGCLAPILPVAAWNTHRGGGLLLTSADAGLNLYLGNNPRATGLPARPPGLRDTPEHEPEDARRIAEKDTGQSMTMAEVSRYWSRQALQFIGDHPGASLHNLLRKLTVLWNAYEIPDNYHYSFMRREFLPSLNWCLTFAFVGPLALLGLILGARRWRSLLPLYAATLPYLGILVLFYIRGRYRMAVVPFLVLFSAFAVERIWASFAEGRWRQRVPLLAGLIPLAVFVNWEYCEEAHHGWPKVCFGGETWFDDEYSKLADWFQLESPSPDPRRASIYLDEALELSRDPHRRAKALFSKGFLSRRLAEIALEGGLAADAELDLRAAEGAFRECLALGYRVEASRAQLSDVRERLERLIGTKALPP